ncbi:MAG: CoA-binding protein [Aliidongia sp.]
MTTDLTRLLRPRSIAVFGGKQAAEVVRQNLGIGFTGEIWPVHPKHAEIAGLPAWRSVAELPGVPDAAFIAVNRHLSIDVAGALAARGCGGAVCYASGFSEAGEDGSDLQGPG